MIFEAVSQVRSKQTSKRSPSGAVSVYVLVAIVRKRLRLDASLYETLQILSLTMFETTPLDQLLTFAPADALLPNFANQLNQ